MAFVLGWPKICQFIGMASNFFLPFLHIFWQYRTGGMALFRALFWVVQDTVKDVMLYLLLHISSFPILLFILLVLASFRDE